MASVPCCSAIPNPRLLAPQTLPQSSFLLPHSVLLGWMIHLISCFLGHLQSSYLIRSLQERGQVLFLSDENTEVQGVEIT